MGLLSLIVFLLIGVFAGWAAGMVMKGRSFGLVANMIIGVIGSFVGGFVFSLLGLSAYGIVGSAIMAFVGAVVLLYIINILKKA